MTDSIDDAEAAIDEALITAMVGVIDAINYTGDPFESLGKTISHGVSIGSKHMSQNLDAKIIDAITDPDITAGALEVLLTEIREAIGVAVKTSAEAMRTAMATVTSPESIRAQALAEAAESRIRKLEGALCPLSKKLDDRIRGTEAAA